MSSALIRTMTSAYLNEMHDVICVNLYHSKSLLNAQKTGVKHPSPTTERPSNHRKMCLIPSIREWKRKLIPLLFLYFKQLYDPSFPSKRCYNFKRFQSDFSIFFQNYPLNQHYRDLQFCHFSTAKIPFWYMAVIRKRVFKRKNNASPINLSNKFLGN